MSEEDVCGRSRRLPRRRSRLRRGGRLSRSVPGSRLRRPQEVAKPEPPFSLPTTPMPPHRLGRRRSRRLRSKESGEARSRPSCLEDKEHGEDKLASAHTQLEVSSLCASQAEALAQVSQPSGRCLSSSPVTRIWELLRRDWGRRFCIRLDLQGCFHTYPDVGGPFQSLLETDEAIDRYLEGCRDPKMCVDKDKAIRQCLYWPDGTIKKRTRSAIAEKSQNRMCQIVQALVDKYNEDHNLLEDLDLGHELKDVLHYQSIRENQIWYYHLNFTTKIKGAVPNECSMDNLFFVEVKCIPQGKHKELVANCFCTVNSNDNGHCYVCTRNGDFGMKHPSSSVIYNAGHVKVGMPFGGCFAKWSNFEGDDDQYVKTREAELRHMFKGLDKPGVMKKLCTPPPWATNKRKVPE